MMRRAISTMAACCLLVSGASAQPTPVLLVHGFNSDSNTWDFTKSVLNATGNYQANAVHLVWTQALFTQKDAVASRLGSSTISAATILVGHSQGGLVSRLVSRDMPVLGLLTIGSPHAGAPIVDSRNQLLVDFAEVELDEALIAFTLPSYCDNHPGDRVCQDPTLDVELDIAGVGLLEATGAIWGIVTLNNDDLRDLSPNSGVVGLLQQAPGQEQAQQRVSIQVDDEEEWAGPFRVLYGAQQAATAASNMMSIGLILELDGIHIDAAIDPGDPNAFSEIEMAGAMEDMGFLLYNFCPIDWNYNIVGSGSNDGVVPWGNQVMPSSRTVTLLNVSHTEETSQASTIRNQLDIMTNRQ